MAPDIIQRLKASALSSALTIYPCQIQVHQTLTFLKLQLLTARKNEWWPATADSLPLAVTCQLTHYVSSNRTHNLPIVMSYALPVGLPRYLIMRSERGAYNDRSVCLHVCPYVCTHWRSVG